MKKFMSNFLNQFKGWTLFEKLLITVVTIMLMITSYLWEDTAFGIVTTLTGILCVVLVSKGNRYNYFWGVINTLFYGIIAYNSNYAGDFVLNIFFYFPMQFIGLAMWNKHYNENADVVEARGFKLKDWIITVIIIAVGTIGIGLIMPVINNILGMEPNPRPFVDSFTTFGSIYAQILMVRRFTEQWYLWIAVNIFSIVMWLTLKDSAMVIMFSAYLINAIYGAYNWKRIEKQPLQASELN